LSRLRLAFALLPLFVTTVIASRAQTFTTIYNFNDIHGSGPEALVQATNGSLYGTTRTGGAYCKGPNAGFGCGTVFRITLAGGLTTLYSFCPQGPGGCTDGADPYAGLIQGANGDLYGTTNGRAEYGEGVGTVFNITPGGALTTLHSFCSDLVGEYCLDGAFSTGGLVQEIDGSFYGTTLYGGPSNNGTIFELTPGGTLTTLYDFCQQSGCTDGSVPYAGLVAATDGNFYGTTGYGGATGNGTIFKLSPSGMLTTLYNFCQQSGCTDGSEPMSLIQAVDGNFYGATISGGASTSCTNGCGTIFRITPSGRLTTLHSFDNMDGANPITPIQATDGDFYGTTSSGGANTNSSCAAGCGTIFKIAPGGTLTTLHNFCEQSGCSDGFTPVAPLLQDTNGEFYGSTYGGGTSTYCTGGCGTLFSLSVGLEPFVETQTTSGKVGATIKILGTNLTGATSVTFNGTAATFTVVSTSEIITTVPSSDSSGFVSVTTPSGVLTSNKQFQVSP
jgi:uncharacterized repeat protein (TIGR03803 family)